MVQRGLVQRRKRYIVAKKLVGSGEQVIEEWVESRNQPSRRIVFKVFDVRLSVERGLRTRKSRWRGPKSAHEDNSEVFALTFSFRVVWLGRASLTSTSCI